MSIGWRYSSDWFIVAEVKSSKHMSAENIILLLHDFGHEKMNICIVCAVGERY